MYDEVGRHFFGPSPWDMDVYASEVNEIAAQLVVRLDELDHRVRRPDRGDTESAGNDSDSTRPHAPAAPR